LISPEKPAGHQGNRTGGHLKAPNAETSAKTALSRIPAESPKKTTSGGYDAAELPPVPANEVRLWLSVIAPNLGNLWRLLLPKGIDNWCLASLQQRLVKDGRAVDQARAVLLAAVGGEPSDNSVFVAMVRRILVARRK
jgi:hypothetical protein